MLDFGFDYPPTVELLDYLALGGLGQPGNLQKAVRLWVMLRSLYGDLEISLPTDQQGWFSNAQWREACVQPELRAKSLRQWLFAEATGIDETHWRQSLITRSGVTADRWLELFGDRASPPTAAGAATCPFQVADRTLRNDFVTLEKLGWLTARGAASQRRYRKVQQFPQFPWLSATLELTTAHFIPNDLAMVADHFPQPINGVQRFILDVEYIVSQSVSQQVDRLLQDLKSLWQQTPVPPVQLTYRSIRYYETEFELITYPVCIYYFQRAPYLFAFGQTPQPQSPHTSADAASRPNWYDYRLDRILSLQALSWADPDLPGSWQVSPSLPQRLPPLFAEKTPTWVEREVAAALGVEIHRPIAPLLLRFERYFYGNYIANTERAKLFLEMDFEQAEQRFQADPETQHQGLSLAQWFRDRPRHKSSVFCGAQHRLGDNNVVMRLRAWGPNVEVLLPLSLRQRMTDDLQETWTLYGNSAGRL